MKEREGVKIHQIQAARYSDIARHIRITPCDVVDFGCGVGTCDMWIRGMRPNVRLTGVDFIGIGKEAVVELKKTDGKVDKVKLFDKFIEGDVLKSGLPNDSYDYAVSAELLEHLEDPHKLIQEMFRVLRSTGRVILTTPYLNRLPSMEHVWSFTLKDVEEMFKRAGFKEVWVSPMASGARTLNEKTGEVLQPEGTWDEIWALASKGGII